MGFKVSGISLLGSRVDMITGLARRCETIGVHFKRYVVQIWLFLLQDVSQVRNLHHLGVIYVEYPRLHGGFSKGEVMLLMVQKSGFIPPGIYRKPVNIGINI